MKRRKPTSSSTKKKISSSLKRRALMSGAGLAAIGGTVYGGNKLIDKVYDTKYTSLLKQTIDADKAFREAYKRYPSKKAALNHLDNMENLANKMVDNVANQRKAKLIAGGVGATALIGGGGAYLAAKRLKRSKKKQR